MTIEFLPATRANTKARIALTGPSGAGKTYTGLTLGCHIAEREGGRLAVIDTERGKSQLYKGLNGWDFDVYTPTSFSPASLIETLGVVAGGGWPVCLLDSWSHYWFSVDGMLDQVDKRTQGGNSFGSGWKAMRPEERRMMDALVSAPFHMIVTLRVKTEYVVVENDRGKKEPKKIGLKPEQRDNVEYEFDVIGDMDMDSTLTVSKTRVPPLSGAAIPKPGTEFADTIVDWLADGEDMLTAEHFREIALTTTSRTDLLSLLDQVKRAGLVHAPMLDLDGNPTVLGDLIIAIGRQLPAEPRVA
jgi:hypothetical protein